VTLTGTGGTARGNLSRWKRLGVGASFLNCTLVPGDIAIDDGVIVAVGLPGRGPDIALPGLVDLQVNGYAGVDAASASVDALVSMGRALARDGVLAYQPTLISDDPEATVAAIARIDQLVQRSSRRASEDLGARILGVHLEGPFLARDWAGAHPKERLRLPDAALSGRLVAAGPVTMVTMAPELPGALDLIPFLVNRGIVVSLGHSGATTEQAAAAVNAGATAVTHLFNAMPPLSSRSPGLAGFALDDRRVRVQMIADGAHVADELLRLAFAAAPGRWSIVTDATSLAGCKEGEADIGGVPIVLSDGVARRTDGTIAGGASTLLSGIQRLESYHLDLAEVFAAATARPAHLLGRRDVGLLQTGAPANLIVLDDRLKLREVMVNGRSIKAS
jgi:N-acetylglucosamine-6-phosphate deacetylase